MARLKVGDPVRVVGNDYRGQAGFVQEIIGRLVTVKLHSGYLTVFHIDELVPILEAGRERDV